MSSRNLGRSTRFRSGWAKMCAAPALHALNQLLVDTMALRDLYKKHHWQVSGATFYQLHLLFDKHYDEQVELMDSIAERISGLGGVQFAAPHDVAETSTIARPPKGRDRCRHRSRGCSMHMKDPDRGAGSAKEAAENGDDGTNDLIVSDVIRRNEMHVFFLSRTPRRRRPAPPPEKRVSDAPIKAGGAIF